MVTIRMSVQMNALIIDALTDAFERRISRRSKKTIQTFSEDCRGVLQDYLQYREVTKLFPNQWDHIWNSDDFGGKQYFAEDYDKIASKQRNTSNNEYTNRQTQKLVLNQLKKELDRERISDWVEWVRTENPNAPQTPPKFSRRC